MTSMFKSFDQSSQNNEVNISRFSYLAFAALLGGFLVLGVGFFQSSVIHNAAHDVRHAIAFPCH
jgi:cobalt transporter subunit CbtB|tara:strand:- start:229 stop:420 length:192 start_codon:yes stop_codon:yes gene_type:complete